FFNNNLNFNKKGSSVIILKNLYIIWIIIWGFGAILGYYMGYDATFTKMFFFLVILYLFPLLPYFYYLIYKKARNTKNIFVATID
ncbi:hypothetical protein ACM4RC_001936, partial [Campylobacter coli]